MTERQTAWVIERYQHNVLEYWSARKKCGNEWERDQQWAIRFASKDAAVTVLIHMLDGDGRVMQHVWVWDDSLADQAPTSSTRRVLIDGKECSFTDPYPDPAAV